MRAALKYVRKLCAEPTGWFSMILCVEMVRVTIYQNIQSCPQDMYMSVHFIVILIRCNILYEEKKLDYI